MGHQEIIIYGTNFAAKQAFDILKGVSECKIVFFTDSNEEKHWTEFCCTLVIPVDEAVKRGYDILICASDPEFVACSLKFLGASHLFMSLDDYINKKGIQINAINEIQKKDFCITKAVSKGSTYYKQEFCDFVVIRDSNYANDGNEYPFSEVTIYDYKEKIKKNTYVTAILKNQTTEGFVATVKFIFQHSKGMGATTILVVSEKMEATILNELQGIVDLLATNMPSYYQDYTVENNIALLPINPFVDTCRYNPIFEPNIQKGNVLCISDLQHGRIPNDVRDTVNEILFGCIDSCEEEKKEIVLLEQWKEDSAIRNQYDSFILEQIPHRNILEQGEELLIAADYTILTNHEQWTSEIESDMVLKALALGKIVICNYNRFLSNYIPNCILVHKREEIPSILNAYLDEEKYEMRVRGIRRIQSQYSFFQILHDIKNQLGLEVRDKNVLVILEQSSESIQEMFEKQTYPYKDSISFEKVSDEIIQRYDFVTFFRAGNEYGMFYLEDMINGFKYTDCDFITKESYYHGKQLIKGKEYEYVSGYQGRYKTVFSVNSDSTLEDLLKEKGCGYGFSIDHTQFFVQDSATCKELHNKDVRYSISIIIAVYNNGELLLEKAIKSLIRCSIFQQLQIIIVDDGSTDKNTISMIWEIERSYGNVYTYFFETGGSGSPSRARNKGYELAEAEYVIALDPDDEVTYDGYRLLLSEIKKAKCDAVLGNLYRIDCGDKIEKHIYYQSFLSRNRGIAYSNSPAKFILESNFEWIGYCNFLIRRDAVLSKERKITQKVGIIGEDHLFIIELLLNCKKVKAVDVLVYYYNSKVSNSLTNSINLQYFKKKRLFVQELFQVLREHNVRIQDYENYFNKKYVEWFVTPMEEVKDRSIVHLCKEEIDKAYQIMQNVLNPFQFVE